MWVATLVSCIADVNSSLQVFRMFSFSDGKGGAELHSRDGNQPESELVMVPFTPDASGTFDFGTADLPMVPVD